MNFNVIIHYDNSQNFPSPHLWVWYDGSVLPDEFAPSGNDDYGVVFNVQVKRSRFRFKFKDGTGTAGPWEHDSSDRMYRPEKRTSPVTSPQREIWCRADKAFIYPVLPREAETISAKQFLQTLSFRQGIFLPDTGGLSGLGATPLADGGVLFGLYHPNAARVHVIGSFNDWQRPGVEHPDPAKFHELKLYTGYFSIPNLWLGVVPDAKVGDEYKFFVQGGVPSDNKGRFQQFFTDPYARQLGADYGLNNSVVVDPTTFVWTDSHWQTPDKADLIIYEMSVYGFTEGDPDVEHPGTFAGVTERIRMGYFNDLGVTALALMPLSEFSGMQGSTVLGYNPSLFCTLERDFGEPDELREMVDAAHAHGLAVILDQVFNHTDNSFNPLWNMILEHPEEEFISHEGGLYFSGQTRWGNRVATEKEDVQNLLIDTCKLLLTEYHVDGFRFDATHTDYMDHGFLLRLADALPAFKPSVILIAENLPNQPDLNRSGYDGFMQWSDPFHDKMKALLREGTFDNSSHYDIDRLGEIFFFCHSVYAAHTNNVVNYVESHDETSVAYEVATNPVLNHPAAKERKSRLGLFASMMALGQPMIYMGGEFNVERDRNIVSFTWSPDGPDSNAFYQWAKRVIRLRRRYPALKISGSNPAADGRFVWILAPWMEARYGGGKKVLGWRLQPNPFPYDRMIVLLNFENHPVRVDLELGMSGTWVKLADLEQANDIPPEGSNSSADPTALHSSDGRFGGFELPGSSGFLYKWEP
ncbi:MAG: alpha-amylase family glycosyl hydrolase [bacterium]